MAATSTTEESEDEEFLEFEQMMGAIGPSEEVEDPTDTAVENLRRVASEVSGQDFTSKPTIKKLPTIGFIQ
jgi:hypothetical protein